MLDCLLQSALIFAMQEMSFSLVIIGRTPLPPAHHAHHALRNSMVAVSVLHVAASMNGGNQWTVRAMVLNGACRADSGLCKQSRPELPALPSLSLASFDTYRKEKSASTTAVASRRSGGGGRHHGRTRHLRSSALGSSASRKFAKAAFRVAGQTSVDNKGAGFFTPRFEL